MASILSGCYKKNLVASTATRFFFSSFIFDMLASVDEGRHGFAGPKPPPDRVLSPCLTPARPLGSSGACLPLSTEANNALVISKVFYSGKQFIYIGVHRDF